MYLLTELLENINAHDCNQTILKLLLQAILEAILSVVRFNTKIKHEKNIKILKLKCLYSKKGVFNQIIVSYSDDYKTIIVNFKIKFESVCIIPTGFDSIIK